MNVPQLTGTVDLVALQTYLCMLLLDDPRLAMVNVLPEFKLQQESDLQVNALWTMPRSAFTVGPSSVTTNPQLNAQNPGPTGAGLLVEMPEASSSSTGVTGPPSNWDLNVVAFEERNVNWTPGTGTMQTAEQWAQVAKDILHLQQVYGFGCLKAKPKWFAPAHDWMTLLPGIMATRVSFEATVGVVQTPRTIVPSVVFGGGNCTLSCVDGTAAIYYTLDGTPPLQANTFATLYTAPFAVNSGDQVTVATRAAGKLLSEVFNFVAP